MPVLFASIQLYLCCRTLESYGFDTCELTVANEVFSCARYHSLGNSNRVFDFYDSQMLIYFEEHFTALVARSSPVDPRVDDVLAGRQVMLVIDFEQIGYGDIIRSAVTVGTEI